MKLPPVVYLVVVLLAGAAASAQAPPPAEDASFWIERLASDETRDRARDKLRDLGAAAVGALVTALRHGDPVIRSESAFVLGRVGRKDAVPALVETLGDGDPRVRANAAYALGELADARAVDALVKTLSDADPAVRANACFALGQLGSAKAAPELVRMLVDADENVRNFAASALGSTKDARVLPALAWSALNDASSGVRALATASMGALGERRACHTLVGLLDDREYVVRARAIEALLVLTKDRRNYDPRDSDAARAGAVARWKSWVARQKLAPIEPRAPVDLYDNWPGRPAPLPLTEPPPDAPEVDLVPAQPGTTGEFPAHPGEANLSADSSAAASAKAEALAKAERVCRQALAANPESASTRFSLAELLLRSGKVAEPLRLYEALDRTAALPEGVDRALVKLRLGTCHRRYGDKDRATALLDEAAASTTSVALIREAARQFAAMKSFARAKTLLERAYNVAGGDAESAWALAVYLLRVPDDALRDPARASVYAEVAFTARPADERFVATMSETAWACGRKDKAVEVLEDALKAGERPALRRRLEEFRELLTPAGGKVENGAGEKRGTEPP